VDAGADIDSALAVAVYEDEPAVIRWLLDAGADVHAKDDLALVGAALMGRADVILILLDAGADARARDDVPMSSAALGGHADAVRILLGAGADVHAHNDKALQLAAQFGYTEVIDILLAQDLATFSTSAIAQQLGLAPRIRDHVGIIHAVVAHVGRNTGGMALEVAGYMPASVRWALAQQQQ
jgi:ankyrin repeat protein